MNKQKHPMATGIALFAAILLIVCMITASCAPLDGTVADTDSGYTYKNKDSAAIPLNDAIYTVSGTVMAGVDSLVRSTTSSYATENVNQLTVTSTGKGFVRLKVTESDSSLAPLEAVVILKTIDTKVIALLPGDVVTLRCHAQAEAIPASYTGQPYDNVLAITWELDYCRLLTPVIGGGKGTK